MCEILLAISTTVPEHAECHGLLALVAKSPSGLMNRLRQDRDGPVEKCFGRVGVPSCPTGGVAAGRRGHRGKLAYGRINYQPSRIPDITPSRVTPMGRECAPKADGGPTPGNVGREFLRIRDLGHVRTTISHLGCWTLRLRVPREATANQPHEPMACQPTPDLTIAAGLDNRCDRGTELRAERSLQCPYQVPRTASNMEWLSGLDSTAGPDFMPADPLRRPASPSAPPPARPAPPWRDP